jgi:acetyl-CoA carboxylase biotin carboxyl carrier protein
MPMGDPDQATGAAGGSSDEATRLLAVIDRLEGLLERSDLSELEVEAGGMVFILRTAAALEPAVPSAPTPERPASSESASEAARESGIEDPGAGLHLVRAPLTGLFYPSPAPGAAPYVRVGTDVNVGQVIGLIEAMKLFNEIKTDIAGTVTRILAESGNLVKAKQPLVEIRPS